ncbi:MAG TPA: helical backbone metal receptor [Chitinophagaceae bacterium]|nr:helical backbone metal receptor [Chitinophagaceae bacterium]
MPVYIDQTGRKVSIPSAKRIVSLVPSQTELLHDLGLSNEVVGITKFCVHPEEWFKTKIRIGGTKQVKMDMVHELQPDLIIANKEENLKEQVEELAKYYPVWVSDVNTINDAYEMIEQVGLITNRKNEAIGIVETIKGNFVQHQTSNLELRTVYLIWKDPYMTIGGDTFIHSMLEAAGFENVFKNKSRYPEVTVDELKTHNLELLLLSSEPYPFKQKHKVELEALLPKTKIVLVDGEMFSWYGSRMVKAPCYFSKLHAEIKDNR